MERSSRTSHKDSPNRQLTSSVKAATGTTARASDVVKPTRRRLASTAGRRGRVTQGEQAFSPVPATPRLSQPARRQRVLRTPVPSHLPVHGEKPACLSPADVATAQADRHNPGLSGTSKIVAYGGVWAAGMDGRAVGGLLGAFASLGEWGAPFAVLAFIGTMYDSYSTYTDARNAGDDYLLVLDLLQEQQAALQAVNDDQGIDADAAAEQAAMRQVIEYNIGILDKWAGAYETAYLSKTSKEQTQQRRNDICTIRARMAKEAQRIATLTSGDLTEDGAQRSPDVLVRLDPEARLAQSRRELEALQGALETLTHRQPEQLDPKGFNPFANLDDLAHAQIKKLRDVYVQLPKAAIDLTVAGLGLSTALEVANLFLQATGLSALSSVLQAVMARHDMEDGKREQRAATGSKLSAMKKAVCAGQLYQAHATEAADPACRYLSWSYQRQQSRHLRVAHRGTNHGQARNLKGTMNVGLAVAAGVLGVTAAAVATPTVVLPVLVTGGVVGASWVSSVAVRSGQKRNDKRSLKDRNAAANAFVQHFGVEGIQQLYADAAVGKAGAWKPKLAALYQRLGADHLAGSVDARFFDIEDLLANPYLAVEHLTHALDVRSREQDPNTYAGEADLVSTLAELDGGGSADPTRLRREGHASAAAYQRELRHSLCRLWGIKPYGHESLPVRDKRDVLALAVTVVTALDTAARGESILMSDDVDDAALFKHLANQKACRDLFELMDRIDEARSGGQTLAVDEATLQTLQGSAARVRQWLRQEHGIGPRQLRQVQALAYRPTNEGLLPGPALLLLKDPQTVRVLELLADPSWLDGPAANDAPPTAPSGAERTRLLESARASSALLSGIRQVGREQRDGPSLREKDARRKARVRARAQRELSAPQRLQRRASKLGRMVKRASQSTMKHLAQLLPNPLGTPERALDAIRYASPTERPDLVRNITCAFLQQVLGPELVLRHPTDPQTLQAIASDKQAYLEAFVLDHLRSGLAATEQAMRTVAAHFSGDKSESRSLHRLHSRLQSTAELLQLLLDELATDRQAFDVLHAVAQLIAPVPMTPVDTPPAWPASDADEDAPDSSQEQFTVSS